MRPSVAASSSKTRMNSSPMMRRFSSGSSTPARRARKRSRASTMTRSHAQVGLERLAQQLRLALAHEPVVDVDAGQPVAHGAMDERRRDRRVDAARERADDPAIRARWRGRARRRARGCRSTVESMKFAGVQSGSRRGDAEHEVGEDVAAARRVRRPRDGTGCRRGCALGSARPAKGVESVWAVALKPAGSRVIESPWLIQTGCSVPRPASSRSPRADGQDGRPVLALWGAHDVAAQLDGHELGAVADAQDRQAAAPDGGIRLRGAAAS